MKNSQKISVVIAAYNEEKRISKVLSVATTHPLVNEVIVVNDGSIDNTSVVAKKFKIHLIENKKNIGKTLTIKKGIDVAKNNLIMLLDADLIGLKKDSLTQLAKPVLDKEVDWSLSFRSNSFSFFKPLQMTKVDWLSGERVIPKDLLLDSMIWSKPEIGYGLEVLMNRSLLSKKKTFRSVHIEGVTNPEKFEKQGFWTGIYKQLHMMYKITRTIPIHEVLWQLVKMTYLNRKYQK